MRRYYYTEADFSIKKAASASLLRVLNPLKPFYSEDGARLEIGTTSAHYENDTVAMEAFARPLWGLAPFWAGGGRDGGSVLLASAGDSDTEERRPEAGMSGGQDACDRSDAATEPAAGQVKSFEQIYASGLAAGTDPEHPEYWHTCRDYDQKFCEMAAIGYAMLLAPGQVWDPLSDKAKKDLTEWLWEINRYECCACNWQWFAIITNLALKVRGMPYSPERMASGLAMLEDYYDAGGWYHDGNGGEKDYYNPFVMVSYGLLYAMFMEEEEPERCARFRQRAKKFAKDYVYWFADDGASIAYGRSMTYRFAQGGFWAFALLSGTEVLPLPVIKGILTRHLVWWLNQPICDNAGILTIGYGYPNLQMSESYNAPGSPYWAFLAFAFLALPDDHPYWKAECAPMPALNRQRYLEHAGMLMQRNSRNVVALVSGRTQSDGHGHTMEKYGKFAYSSRFGFSISRSSLSLAEEAPDSMLTFAVDGRYYARNTIDKGYVIGADGIKCEWSPHPSIQVETQIHPTETGHIRTHRITSEIDCMAYDGGFALSADRPLASWMGGIASGEVLTKQTRDKQMDCDAGTVSVLADAEISDAEKVERLAERIKKPDKGQTQNGKTLSDPERGRFYQIADEDFATVESAGDYCTVRSLLGDGQGLVLTPAPNTNLINPKTWIPMVAYQIRKGTQTVQTEVSYL